jgi:hypothetical protein
MNSKASFLVIPEKERSLDTVITMQLQPPVKVWSLSYQMEDSEQQLPN